MEWYVCCVCQPHRAPHPCVTVKYHGFVNLDVKEGTLPSTASVDKAAKMLKGNKKEARQIHPLFARGLETPLDMTVCLPTNDDCGSVFSAHLNRTHPSRCLWMD